MLPGGVEPYDLRYLAHTSGVGSVLGAYRSYSTNLPTAAIGCTAGDLDALDRDLSMV